MYEGDRSCRYFPNSAPRGVFHGKPIYSANSCPFTDIDSLKDLGYNYIEMFLLIFSMYVRIRACMVIFRFLFGILTCEYIDDIWS